LDAVAQPQLGEQVVDVRLDRRLAADVGRVDSWTIDL
jgi:hypothetical protein